MAYMIMRLTITTVFALLCCQAYAIDIVTIPSANQLRSGEIDLSAYYVRLDQPKQFPQFASLREVGIGISDLLEIDVLHLDRDKDKDSVFLNTYLKVLKETRTLPDVSVGAWNITSASTSDVPSLKESTERTSYFIVSAKTIPLTEVIGPPYARIHLGLGTPDYTLLGNKRHDAVFGGTQFRLTPTFGFSVLYDGESWVTGVAFVPVRYGWSVRGGTVGSENWWAGISYRTDLWK